MNKFLILYKSTGGADDWTATPPEQRQALMAAWMGWQKEIGDALVDFGSPLGNSMKVVKGSSSPNPSEVSGYSIVQGESVKAIADMCKDHPHFLTPGSSIEVHELHSMPAM